MPAKRHTASRARLMALNSMCATACSRAARPSVVNGERRGSADAGTSRGRGGRPGRRRARLQQRGLGVQRRSPAACSACAAAALACGVGQPQGLERGLHEAPSLELSTLPSVGDAHGDLSARGRRTPHRRHGLGGRQRHRHRPRAAWPRAPASGSAPCCAATTNRITVGARSNVQDGSVLHADLGSPLTLGDRRHGRPPGHAAWLHRRRRHR